jgi:flagellar secretion chaperone FliS
MTPSDPHKEYIASRVAAATPVELTRMLYEGAVKSVQEAVTAHRAGDILARGNAVTKAVQILGELRFSLRRDVAPQYCDTLSGLYGYLQNRLIQAHAEKSESMLQEVGGLIQNLLEGWIGAMHNLSALDAAVGQSAGPGDAGSSDAGSATMQPAVALSGASNPYSSPYSSAYSSTTTPAPAQESQNRSWEF